MAKYMKKGSSVVLLILFCIGLAPMGVMAQTGTDPLDNWTLENSPTTETLDGIAYGNGTFVTVGGSGIILTSPDGKAWTNNTPSNIIPPVALTKIAYGNGTFVAVGDAILTSEDNGKTWTKTLIPSENGNFFNAIAFANGTFVAAEVFFTNSCLSPLPSSFFPDAHSFLYTSPDGITWTRRTQKLTALITAVTYANGTWIAVGAHTELDVAEEAKIFFSGNNGNTWKATKGQFVVQHNVVPEGTFCTELLYGKQLTFGNGLFWAIPYGKGTLINSAQGIRNWTNLSVSTSVTDRFNSITYGNGFFVVVGVEGIIVTSAFGENWTFRISGTINELHDVTFGKDTFVAVGYGGIIIQSAPVTVTGPVPVVSKRRIESNLWSFSEGLAAVKIADTSWGFISNTGRVVLNPIYDSTLGFSEALAAVKIQDKVGFINKNGTTLIALQYDDAKSFSEGLAAVKIGNKWGFINKRGIIMAELQFDNAWSFSESLAAVKLGNKVGFVNTRGRIMITPQYDDSLDFSEGFAAVLFEGKWGFVNKKGALFEPIFDDAQSFSEGFAPVSLNGKWGFVSTDIAASIQPQFDYALPFSGGFALVEIGNKWGFINAGGSIVIPAQFDGAKSFSEHLAAVQVGDKWGFIDENGVTVIEPQFDDVLGFSKGLAAVNVGGKVGFINNQGQIVISPQFDLSGNF